MARKIIELMVRGGNRLVPRDGRSQLETNDVIVFRPPPGGSGGEITFVDASPFAKQVVNYGVELLVIREHDRENPEANVLKYSCSGNVNGQALSSESGGEVEIIRP
jgi:hypothetical protein